MSPHGEGVRTETREVCGLRMPLQCHLYSKMILNPSSVVGLLDVIKHLSHFDKITVKVVAACSV